MNSLCCFTKPFKCDVITPLIRKTSLPKENLKNYRAVSRLSFLPKLVERVVAAPIRSFTDSNDLTKTVQLAYIAGHATGAVYSKQGTHVSGQVYA